MIQIDRFFLDLYCKYLIINVVYISELNMKSFVSRKARKNDPKMFKVQIWLHG